MSDTNRLAMLCSLLMLPKASHCNLLRLRNLVPGPLGICPLRTSLGSFLPGNTRTLVFGELVQIMLAQPSANRTPDTETPTHSCRSRSQPNCAMRGSLLPWSLIGLIRLFEEGSVPDICATSAPWHKLGMHLLMLGIGMICRAGVDARRAPFYTARALLFAPRLPDSPTRLDSPTPRRLLRLLLLSVGNCWR